jgi:hypothetical protein
MTLDLQVMKPATAGVQTATILGLPANLNF